MFIVEQKDIFYYYYYWGYVVAQLVEAQRYKLEGCGFDS
jgi:hypothetical protein